MSNYRELYKGLTKHPPQRLITDFTVREKKTSVKKTWARGNFNIIIIESFLQPIQKKIRVLPDSGE